MSAKVWTTVSVTSLAPGIFVKLKFTNEGQEYTWPAVALLHQRWTDPQSAQKLERVVLGVLNLAEVEAVDAQEGRFMLLNVDTSGWAPGYPAVP